MWKKSFETLINVPSKLRNALKSGSKFPQTTFMRLYFTATHNMQRRGDASPSELVSTLHPHPPPPPVNPQIKA